MEYKPTHLLNISSPPSTVAVQDTSATVPDLARLGPLAMSGELRLHRLDPSSEAAGGARDMLVSVNLHRLCSALPAAWGDLYLSSMRT